MTKISVDSIIVDAEQILTLSPAVTAGSESDPDIAELGVILDGAVAIRDGIVVDVGTTEKILDVYEGVKAINARDHVIAPGLIDAHTHAVFAGSRHLEFGMRMRGASYLDVLAAGGGIHSTVEATRAAPVEELVSQALPRLARALRYGVTTMEIKSGYGLDEKTEIKMLQAIRALNACQPVRLVPTYLGAHVVPREYENRRQLYIEQMTTQVIPHIARLGLASACDVFLDNGAYDIDEARVVLEAAVAHGLAPKIHAGQFSDQGGPELIAEMGGLSAEHLEQISPDGVAAMARAGVVANLLPGAALSLRDRFPDGRRFVDAGVAVALATDNNPGSSRTENLPLMATIGTTRMGLTCAEAWKGITVNASKALGISDEAGSIVAGRRADLLLLAIPDFRAFLYHFGVNHVALVMVRGVIATDNRNT